jgi:hypothetical protein
VAQLDASNATAIHADRAGTGRSITSQVPSVKQFDAFDCFSSAAKLILDW